MICKLLDLAQEAHICICICTQTQEIEGDSRKFSKHLHGVRADCGDGGGDLWQLPVVRPSRELQEERFALEASSCSGKDNGGTQFVGEDLWLGVQRKQLRSLWWCVDWRIELLKPHQRSLWWQVEAGQHRVVAGLQRSGSTKAGRTSDGNCRRQGKGEELIYNQKLQNREDLVLLAAGGLYVLVKGS